MKSGFISGILYSVGIAMISKGMYELGKQHERKELIKMIKTIDVAKDMYKKEEKES